ncbi:phenylalanine--tRNA ligase subunit beta [Candidatus Woesearchaeota archaeon]|jgi:phenylalanyl-tRNA synthetase beta chain|nr:phenylalanine--tRNA ligase subunit beta [Candidatus Woesearchaeota archaeon]MBT7062699.1 phenylalanine--tRNA ligase subunit beta [Candidatus Woesearchaeota archaeon]MBT7402468.1 phenylalanine--tRNA ligase subunit beta [Candidatus Woesearchaeota archaeon]
MPKFEISKKDIEKLIGHSIKDDERNDLLAYAKCEFEEGDGDIIKVDCKDTNRPDLWCVEGVARQIAGGLGKEKGVPQYIVHKSDYLVRVDSNLKGIRPRTACAVVKGIKITDEVLKQIIQMQEKVSGTFGRNRKEAAIGVYDFDKIKWPILYKAYDPDKLSFMALEMPQSLTLRKILQKHPKGREFAHLLDGKKKYPVFIDSAKNVLSMPPIINSNYSGKVTAETKNLFIEVSGFKDRFVHTALNSMIASLADRGGKIYEVKVKYGLRETLLCPDFRPRKTKLSLDLFNKLSGLGSSSKELVELLRRARLNAKIVGDNIFVEYPSYRIDIMHSVDLVEDALISYGFNKIDAELPRLAVQGSETKLEVFSRRVREWLVGFGAQEIATFTLTNKDKLFTRMNLSNQKCMEIANPVSQNWSVLRNWLTPTVIDFFSNNTNCEYPQTIFEVGEVILPNAKAETMSDTVKKLVFARSHKNANFTEIKQVLQSLLSGLEVEFEVEETEHNSFISGRVGSIKVNDKEIGIIGELHPQVLKNWRLENPIVLFELDLNELLKLI